MTGATAQVTKTIDASPNDIWSALTTPAKFKQYFFGAEVLSDWEVGHQIRLRGDYKGEPYEDKGEILVAEPNRRLDFSHWSPRSGAPDTPENYHVVSFALAPDGPRTKVTLTQSNLKGGVKSSDEAHRAEYEKNWSAVLDGLARTVMS